MEGNVVRLPRRPLAKPAVWLDGSVQSGCDELVHLWEGLAEGEQPHEGMRCQCGERVWERIEEVEVVTVTASEGVSVRVRPPAVTLELLPLDSRGTIWEGGLTFTWTPGERPCCGDPCDCGEECG